MNRPSGGGRVHRGGDNMNWDSPVSSGQVASAADTASETRMLGSRVYWLERRPRQAGRTTIMMHDGASEQELLPDDYDCRSRVHEYGGGAWQLDEQAIYFVNDADQQVHCLQDGKVRRITDARNHRFADLQIDATHGRLIAVCERHPDVGMPLNSLVSISIDSGRITVLCDDHDFYAGPRLDDDGRLAWLSWDLPDMPWDSSSLHLASLTENDTLEDERIIAGGEGVSLFQPEWHDGVLYYVSDTSGWWQLYRYHGDSHTALLPVNAEFGQPLWVFGQSTYCFMGNQLIACANHDGMHSLYTLDLASLEYRQLQLPYIGFDYLAGDDACCGMIASSSDRAYELIVLDASGNVHIASAAKRQIDDEFVSVARALTMRSREQDDIHAFYYAPKHPQHDADGIPPPMIVIGHGGPTGQASPAFDIRKQYWTSRGFAILDVNYSGSTGYGRAYRERLLGRWGVRDVNDLCDAALSVCESGLADRERLIIKGSSAGGYSVLAALTFEDVFRAGASYYGISDLETLDDGTHKFEAGYLHSLVGPYPEQRDVYRQRSPIHHVDRLHCPVIFLQGEEDKVVPKEQAETMLEALREKGIPVAYRLYPGEQHGFRRADTIVDALESELCFYRKLFSAGEVDCPLEIENLESIQ